MSKVDVCLILEGTYPYVSGGVSSWTHELITRQDHLTFHIISILPRDAKPEMVYTLPPNVRGITTLHLQQLPEGSALARPVAERLFEELKQPLINLTTGKADLQDFKSIMDTISPYQKKLGSKTMLDSETAWELVTSMYETSFVESSMLDYFWTWRAMMAGLCSLLLVELPRARCYHVLSTGYAGLLAARAKLETGRPVTLTEHGIYTNERRIEIASADWLEETASKAMTIDHTRLNLRDLWIDTFTNYSRICYQACDHIITLFTGNQQAQTEDGAEVRRMRVIPNGVDTVRYGAIQRKPQSRPTIALIGRVVPIKDIKNFLRAVAALNQTVPELHALIIGPLDEDPEYAEECQHMVEYFALNNTVTFTGQVAIEDYLPQIEVVVSSSISEAQPLAILEAGACGIPTVATDVGACREMILGKPDEDPKLGAGGIVVPLSNPQALAEGVLRLLSDREFYDRCSKTIRQRVVTYYNKQDQHLAYQALYSACM